ncbi:MAG: DMT family transporter [Candidatus Dormibacteraeota bacterium]|nr:DMT family transporter [Candidatus Dormibacteraeota bacterium]
MPLAVLPLVLLAAVCHAAWNALVKESANPLVLSARAVAWGTGLSLPFVLTAWLMSGRPGLAPAAWALAAMSASLELLYFVFLSTAYQRGELSVVYPLARGTAPLLAVLVGVTLLGERLHLVAAGAILLVLAGIWTVRRPSGAASGVLLPALATGVMIAAYTSLDRVGVRLAPPWLYGWVLWLFAAIFLGTYTRLRGLTRTGAGDLPSVPTSMLVGALMTAAYFMILVALSRAPLAVIAPVRESAIVLVTAWGIWRLHERQGAWLRMGGAVAIVVGIALLTFA